VFEQAKRKAIRVSIRDLLKRELYDADHTFGSSTAKGEKIMDEEQSISI
jgi:hypothetical protein